MFKNKTKRLRKHNLAEVIKLLFTDPHLYIEKTFDTFKRIYVVVANAGIVSSSRLENLKMEDFDKVMNINCRE